MSHRLSSLLLSVAIASLIFTACSKKFSSDNPLPTSYYPSIIINSDNNVVYAIDPKTGKKNWQFSMPNDSGTLGAPYKPSPIVYNNRVYLTGVNSDTVYKLNSETGVLIKKLFLDPNTHPAYAYPMHFFTIVGTPIADGNLLYLATTNDTLYAIDTGTAVVKWKFGAADGSAFYASPVIYNGNIYVATIGSGTPGSSNGHMYCINKTSGPDATGNPIWDYPGLGVVSNASFISSPSVSAPYIYAGSVSDSNMYCIYLNPAIPPSPPTPLVGIARWMYKTGGKILSSPTTYAGICIFGCDDFYVYCLDTSLTSILKPSTSNFRWKYFTHSQVRSSPIISNQVVYVGSYDYYLYALNIIDGSKKWSYKTKGLIKSSPVPYNGSVYVGSYDNYLYSIDTTYGSLKWSYYINGNIECSPAIDDLSGRNQLNSGISGYNTSGNTN